MGFGTGFFSREIVVVSMAIAKPVAKTIVRASMLGIEKGKESLAHLKETFEDMMAEVREGMTMRESEDEDLIEGEDKKKEQRVEGGRRDQSEEGKHSRADSDAAKIKQQHKGSTP
jgi:hypothetical protein